MHGWFPRFAATATAAVLLCGSAPSQPARKGAATTTTEARRGIQETLDRVNALLKRGTNADEVAAAMYAPDLEIIVEGEPRFFHSLGAFKPELAQYVAEPCTLKALDPIRHSGDLAVAWIDERCPGAKPGEPESRWRLLYVFRKLPQGWRVTMESAAAGTFDRIALR